MKYARLRVSYCLTALLAASAIVPSGTAYATPHLRSSAATSLRPEPARPKSTPTPTPTKSSTPTSTPSPTGQPSPTGTPVPNPTATVTPQPSPVPSPSVLFPPAPPMSQYAYGALKFVRKQVGKKYVTGGNGPNVFDCSGLTQQAWKAVGVALPRVSGDQFFATVRIQYSDLQPGDMVFFGPNGSRHVGMYIGNDKMIDAANHRDGVKISDLTQNWYRVNLAGYGRVEADDF